jgi:hypothetical protein
LQKVSGVDECKSIWFYLLLLKEKPCLAFEVRPQRRDGAKRRRKKENVVLLKHAFLSYTSRRSRMGGLPSSFQVSILHVPKRLRLFDLFYRRGGAENERKKEKNKMST